MKSRACAFVPGAAATVSVAASVDGRDRVAVTVATPPASETVAGFSASVACGAASSSFSVNDAPVTSPSAPTAFATSAVTVTLRPALPWWTSSSAAVTVASSSLLLVAPAAMTMVASPTA